MKELERAFKKAYKKQHMNTRIGVLHISDKEFRGVLVLRPDQDWMTARLQEFNIPYIIAQEIWPPVTDHNPVLAPQSKRYRFNDAEDRKRLNRNTG